MSDCNRWKYLERDRFSSYRQLSVKGRRIRARTLYSAYVNPDEPRTPEQIAADFDVPVEAVREAIAYCESDPPEIRQDWEDEEALYRASGMDKPEYYTSRGWPVPPGLQENRGPDQV